MVETRIYVLKLENDKYYVGKSTNVDARIAAHKSGNGSSWTKKHKYVDTLLVSDAIPSGQAGFHEDMWTKQAMAHFGIENVRGGSYSFDTLYPAAVLAIQREIIGALDLCYKCGGNHFTGGCGQTATRTLWTCDRCHGYTHTRAECHRWRCEDCGDDCSGGDCPADIDRHEYYSNYHDDDTYCDYCGGDCPGSRCAEEDAAWEAMMAAADEHSDYDNYESPQHDMIELHSCIWCPNYHIDAADAEYCDEAPCCTGCGIPKHSNCECHLNFTM